MTNETAATEKVIQNVETLDLTAMQVADLAEIEAIKNVETLIVAESAMGTLAKIPMENVEDIIPVPDDKKINVRTINGPMQVGGGSLVNEDEQSLTLMTINGPLVFTTPVTTTQGHLLLINGPVFAPHGSDDALGAAIHNLNGPLVYYNADGEVKIQAGQAKIECCCFGKPKRQP